MVSGWIDALRGWPERLRTRRRRREQWEARWSDPAFAPRWGGRPAPPEIEEAVASGWLPPAGRVLELGCGRGEIAAWFAERGYEVVGVDLAEAAIHQARALHARLARPPEFRALDLCAERPPGRPFDILVDRGCLHKVPDNLVPAFVKNVAAAAGRDARMMLFIRAYRTGNPFAHEGETRERVGWVEEIMRGRFRIDRYRPVWLNVGGKPDPANPLPGIAFWLARDSAR